MFFKKLSNYDSDVYAMVDNFLVLAQEDKREREFVDKNIKSYAYMISYIEQVISFLKTTRAKLLAGDCGCKNSKVKSIYLNDSKSNSIVSIIKLYNKAMEVMDFQVTSLRLKYEGKLSFELKKFLYNEQPILIRKNFEFLLKLERYINDLINSCPNCSGNCPKLQEGEIIT